jgi:hypothetical protein
MPMGLVATAPRGAWAAFAPRGDGAVIANWAFAMTQAPGGAWVCPVQGHDCPYAMWCLGLPRARAKQLKRQVSLRE